MFGSSVYAQETENTEDDDQETEIIEVLGIADSYRNAIAEKRNSNTIVDALSSADIGALPDLSVAETLERITGVTGDRFKGNASEISIRGLGPFLGFATVNGRAISSGSGNRSVAFSQFPSELVNGVVVYKAQKADILEGGVSGTIDLKTIKPVDYGKERFQAQYRASYNPYHKKQSDENGVGNRISVSYTNAFDTDALGEVGFALGYAGVRGSTPEESYNTSSTLRNCNSNFAVDGGSNCSFDDDNVAANGGAAEDGPYYFIPNSFFYRQMKSEEDRDAAIFALQIKPNSNLDINLDAQWSERFYFEDRHDLLWDDGRRKISNWATNQEDALLSYTGESRISSYGEYRQRNEEYLGAGLNVDWQISDDWAVEFDASLSDTDRFQTRTYARFRGERKFYDWEGSNGSDWPRVTNVYSDFNDPQGSSEDWLSDIQDLAYFSADSEARNYRFDISDSINAYKLHFDYAIEAGPFYNVKYGVDYSTRDHKNFLEKRNTVRTPRDDRPTVIANVAATCAIDFPQSDYGEDANSNLTSWATFDTFCGYDAIVGDQDITADPTEPSEGNINLTEDITSLFVMAEFSTEWGDMPVDGNIGVRRVKTDITSIGLKTSYRVETDEEGNILLLENTTDLGDTLEINTLRNSYSANLPSINLALGVLDDVQVRFAFYKGLSRPDMWYYGAGRNIRGPGDSEEFDSLADALEGRVTAIGNPFLEALESTNYDIATSWFINDDTMLSAALYYKTFNARFELIDEVEPVTIDGEEVDVVVENRPTIIDDDSSINGYELTALHKFDWLEGFWSGFGTSINYNFANSDFETPERGASISESVQGLIPPSNIAGLSKHNFSTQLYWENKKLSARLSYKYRSEYLKPFGANLGQTNRIVDNTKSIDFDISYKITKQLKAKFQAINITNEPYIEQRVSAEAYNRIEYSGPRYFIGLQYRL